MYLFSGILFTLCLLFVLLSRFRKRRIIRRIRRMDYCEKACLLNRLLRPFGFAYYAQQDSVTSTLDAWQREFGYHALFDRTAPRFHMIFDCEPVYFAYQGRTWMIELWKGQYGINTGGEIGIYHADSLLEAKQYERALFHSAADQEMLDMTMELYHNGKRLFSIRRTHWWLTGFCIGHYCEPADLTMHVSIVFPDPRMLYQFADGLRRAGYDPCEYHIDGPRISFPFSSSHGQKPRASLLIRILQWENRLLCRWYRSVTKPFSAAADRLLYLYYFLPSAFRKTLRFRKNRRQKYRAAKGRRKP